MEPWQLIISGDLADIARLQEVVYHTAEALRVSGILLQPFMPEKANLLLDILGVDRSRRSFEDAKFGVDGDYGGLKTPVIKHGLDTRWHIMFPPLSVKS